MITIRFNLVSTRYYIDRGLQRCLNKNFGKNILEPLACYQIYKDNIFLSNMLLVKVYYRYNTGSHVLWYHLETEDNTPLMFSLPSPIKFTKLEIRHSKYFINLSKEEKSIWYVKNYILNKP